MGSLIAIILGSMLVVAGVILVIRDWGKIDSKSYKGKVVFETANEYKRFKRAVGDKNVRWFKGDVLSSEPPVVVQFTAEAEPDYEFPYGEATINTKLYGVGWYLLCFNIGGLLLFVGIILLFVG